ncbi:MAG: hypothetical protein GVY29_02950 [Spirochaetes bacterium]|jgi:riboflavin-specific deaminase-like protein|nr:hypothetical protein [Spirochaetota bacterium]
MLQPTVIASFAQSADGRIATKTGASRSISGEQTTTLAHQLRDYADAILVGIGTVLRDDPELTCRIPGGTSPLRVILDAHLRLPTDGKIAKTAGAVPTIVCTTRSGVAANSERSAELIAQGITLRELPEAPRRQRHCGPDAGSTCIDIPALLSALAEMGVETLFIEGGSTVLARFLAARAIDTLIVVMAPILIGAGTPSFAPGVLPKETVLQTQGMLRMGRDLVWEVRPRYD